MLLPLQTHGQSGGAKTSLCVLAFAFWHCGLLCHHFNSERFHRSCSEAHVNRTGKRRITWQTKNTS